MFVSLRSIGKNNLLRLVAGLVLVGAGLYVTSLYSYLLFHTVAEGFSIVIAISLFMIAWNTRQLTTNNYVLFLGIAFFFVGLIDFAHTLAYKGMGIFTGYDANLPTQLWIAARYLQSLSLLAAPWFIDRKPNIGAILVIYLSATILLLAAVFSGTLFPACFVEGQGLTPFKIVSEYIICFILIASLALLLHHRDKFDPHILRLIVWAILFTIVSELAFTFYVSVYGLSNLIGHYFKIFAFYFVYRAIIVTGLKNPYSLIFHDLEQNRQETQTILDAAPIMIFYKDCENRFIRVNKALAEAMRLPKEGIEGKTAPEVYPDQATDYLKDDREVIASGTPQIGIIEPIETADGTRWVQTDKIPYRDMDGSIIGIVGFSIDITDRRQMEKELQENESRMHAITDSAQDAILMMDPEGRISYWNPSAERILGYTAVEAIGQNLHQLIAPPHYHEAHHAAFSVFQQKGQGAAVGKTLDLKAIRKDGKEIPVQLSLAAIHMKGAWHAVGIIRDITARKQAEEKIKTSLREKETMLKEIHHRVKNNLTVISSLLYMQSSSVDNEKAREALKASMARVKTMAMIHTQLYQYQDLSQVDFGLFIRDLTGSINQLYRNDESPVEITIDCDEIHLDIDTSIPCGLILNELVSNALKHAFPEGRGGEIHIAMRLEDTTAVLTVQDNGIGFPESIDVLKAKSLGLELVNILVGQMNGTIDRQVDSGTIWTITLSVKNGRKVHNG